MSIFDKIKDKIKEKKAEDFYDGLDKTPYKYSNKTLASHIKGSDKLMADSAEVIGRALSAEMNKSGKPLSGKIYRAVKDKFLKLPTTNKDYINAADAYLHAGDAAICKYLIGTWEHGDDLGHAIGLSDEKIARIKKDLAQTYAQESVNTDTLSRDR